MLVLELRRRRQSQRLLAHCGQPRGLLLLQAPLMLLLHLFAVFLEVHQTRQAHSLELGDELLHGLIQVEAGAEEHEGDTGGMREDRIVQVDLTD
jgi:hypothetical protein